VDKDKAIKLAYEVLEYIHEGAHTGISWRDVAMRAKPALTAIEKALTQSKHTPTLGVMVANHEQQIKDIMAHLLELKPMNMQQRYEAQILKSREDTLNAAGFYRKNEWIGIGLVKADEDYEKLLKERGTTVDDAWQKYCEEMMPQKTAHIYPLAGAMYKTFVTGWNAALKEKK